MSLNSIEVMRKVSKWTDDIKRDNKYYGAGNVSNQIHLANGTKIVHPCEDRSFAYELKDSEIFAYGILDGYNGEWAVDLIEQCLLTNVYFDHLSTLQSKSDDEIYSILKVEFQKCEQTLQENIQDQLMKRASRTFLNGELRRGTVEFMENAREIKQLDSQINSGAFATIALIIDDRLFVANVGTSHCFVCVYDQLVNEKKVISLESDHTLNNIEEVMRLSKLKANVSELSAQKLKAQVSVSAPYTRCLGDFKLKLYYHEYPFYKDCTGPPLICEPQHPSRSLLIDNSFLFMAIYSDALVKIIELTDFNTENTCALIGKMLIGKIISEQTLNSAAQSVLDEIKRAYDDKFSSAEYSEREDLTLIIRVFEDNIKQKLINIENAMNSGAGGCGSAAAACDASAVDEVCFIESSQDVLDAFNDEELSSLSTMDENATNRSLTMSSNMTATATSLSSAAQTTRPPLATKRADKPVETFLDENGKVKTYVDFGELNRLLEADDENRLVIEGLCGQLEALGAQAAAAAAAASSRENDEDLHQPQEITRI